jgi:hypothetical protein
MQSVTFMMKYSTIKHFFLKGLPKNIKRVNSSFFATLNHEVWSNTKKKSLTFYSYEL